MVAAMDANAMRQLHRRVPFQPVALHLVDGRKLDVPQPELLSISVSGRRVVVERPDDWRESVCVPSILRVGVCGASASV